MSASIDFQNEVVRLKSSIAISNIICTSVPLTKKGHEFMACCPFHGEKTPSFSVNDSKGFYHCFGCGEHGDVFDWLLKRHDMKLPEAVQHLNGNLPAPESAHAAPVARPKPTPATDWAAIIPVPDDAPAPPTGHFKHGAPSHVAHYQTRDGGTVGYIHRFDLDGGKEFCPWTYCQNAAGRNEWRAQSFPKPRSLYGAELLNRGGRVLLVEGEITAEAARRLVGDHLTVMSWPGGAKAIGHTDWSMLAGHDVVIWPDADKPGTDAAALITIQLRHHGATVRTIDPPANVPKGWDAADAETEGWEAASVLRHIDPPEPEPEYNDYEPHDGGSHDGAGHDEPASFDFAPLGHDHGKFYFYTAGGGQVREFSARDLQSVGPLCELASLRYWELNHPGKGDAGFNVRGAGDTLVRACYKVGIYDTDRIRGRGAWIDDGRAVLHMGDKLIVDGQKSGLVLAGSKHIYEAAKPLTKLHAEPLTTAQAHKLVGLCKSPTWQQPISGVLLAGFIVVAPICGGLAWRPSIWITGGAGSGKSWLKDNILAPAMGGVALLVQSKTSEAGIRQTLGCDALPVLFDEAEREDASAAARMQGVLDLMRQSSSEGGAEIVKGSQSQTGAKRYRIRSCFALSSINVGIDHQADESRITVLALRERDPSKAAESEAKFAETNRQVQETITAKFAAGLLARSVRLLPVIRANAEVFARVVSVVSGSRRAGDQIGALLAGAYSLHSDRVISTEAAELFVSKQDWGAASKGEVERDELRLINHIIQQRIRISGGNVGTMDASIGRLISAAYHNDKQIMPHAAKMVLGEHGLKFARVDGVPGIFVSTGHIALKKMMVGTPWSGGWTQALGRLNGAVTGDKRTIRFTSTVTSKAAWVPISAFDDGTPDDEPDEASNTDDWRNGH